MATTVPQAIASRSAVRISRRKALANQRQVTRTECSVWIVTLIDCILTLSFNASTMVRKNAMTKLRASVASNTPANSAHIVALATVASSHGKR